MNGSEALAKFIEKKVRPSKRKYHAEDLTIQFLIDYLPESNPWRPSSGKWLRQWDNRPSIPPSLHHLRNAVLATVNSRVIEMQNEEQKLRATESTRIATEILSRNASRIERFLEIAYRKVATPDDYGDENPKALDQEILRFVAKLRESEKELRDNLYWSDKKQTLNNLAWSPIARPIVQTLRDRFTEYYQIRKRAPD